MTISMGITSKLLISFCSFIFIFYGTLLTLFINIQNLIETSEQIVNVNNQVAALAKTVSNNLIDIELNDKKFRLLKKESYLELFETAKMELKSNLEAIVFLSPEQSDTKASWETILTDVNLHSGRSENLPNAKSNKPWADDTLITAWTSEISKASTANQLQTNKALLKINALGKNNMMISLIGFGFSVAIGLCVAIFISRSMLTPVKKLTDGLKTVSNDNYDHLIHVETHDEFREMADAFNEMTHQLKADENIRSDFIASLSHEIRTPLTSTQEAVHLITEEILGPVNERQKKFLNIAGSEINRINHLLNHLLNVSVLEGGPAKSKPEVVDPNRLVKDACTRLLSKAKLCRVKINLNLCKAAVPVFCIKKEIIQVLINIIGNGIKFSPKGGELDVSILYQKKDTTVTFKVSDSGPGIPVEEQLLIFKKYYRAKGTKKNTDGVGLGLNISKKIVLSHGGVIYMKNNDPKGSSFYFTLPVAPKNMPLESDRTDSDTND